MMKYAANLFVVGALSDADGSAAVLYDERF
jgi:hypothetical protein